MTYQTLTVEVTERLGVVTISRPEARNALSRQVLADLAAALTALRDDDRVGVVVITGAGDRAFAAGADISQLQDYTLHTGLDAEMQRLFDEIEAFEKPTMHFFNPALVMRCVEIVAGPQTAPSAVETISKLTRRLGKEPVLLHKEIPGFIANRILGAARDEAIFLLENGVASAEAIDTACRTALGYPMGPFELMDLTGIDISYHAKLARHAVSNDPRDLPGRSMTDLVERGELGRKTGVGFYRYDDQGTKHPREHRGTGQ